MIRMTLLGEIYCGPLNFGKLPYGTARAEKQALSSTINTIKELPKGFRV